MTRWYLIAPLVLAACGAPPPDPDGGTDAGPTQADDAGPTAPHDAGHDAGVVPLSLSFTAPPAAVTAVRGMVDIQLIIQGGTPDRVELWKDGSVLVALPPPYSYTWNTDAESEGTHVLEARAMSGEEVAGRAVRAFVVDRTAPTIVERLPARDSATQALASPLVAVFSEEVATASLADGVSVTTTDGAPLAHTFAQVSPGRVEVRLTEAPPTLPATATVTFGATITDLAGNALGADDAWSFTFPAWVEGEALGTRSNDILDTTIAGDGTLWVLYRVSTSSFTIELRATRWDGASWQDVPTPLREGLSFVTDACIRTRASGRAVVAWSGRVDGVDELRLREQYGTGWVGYSPPRRADESAHDLDLEIEADGSVVLSRQLSSEYLVDRYTGRWTPIGDPLPAPEVSSYGLAELAPSDEGLRFVYGYEFDCKIVQETSAGWTAPSDLKQGNDWDNRCVSVRLVRSGSAEPHWFAFLNYNSPEYRGGARAETQLLTLSESERWSAVPGLSSHPSRWMSAVPSITGWYALGQVGSAARVYDESLSALDGGVEAAIAAFARGGQPIVVTHSGSVLVMNALP